MTNCRIDLCLLPKEAGKLMEAFPLFCTGWQRALWGEEIPMYHVVADTCFIHSPRSQIQMHVPTPFSRCWYRRAALHQPRFQFVLHPLICSCLESAIAAYEHIYCIIELGTKHPFLLPGFVSISAFHRCSPALKSSLKCALFPLF